VSNSFSPNHPKSILYSIHTIYHRLIRVVLGERFHILDIVEGQNYNEAEGKGKEITRVRGFAQDTGRRQRGWESTRVYATTVKK